MKIKFLFILVILVAFSGCATTGNGTSFTLTYNEETGDFSTGVIWLPKPTGK